MRISVEEEPKNKMEKLTKEEIEKTAKAILENQFDISGWYVAPTLMSACMESMRIMAEWVESRQTINQPPATV